jgi:hypothetical protein
MPISDQEASLAERLFKAGNPRDLADWESRDGYYVTTCRVSATDVPGLISLVQKWNDENWPSEDEPLLGDHDTELLPVTAWRTLADLKAESAVEPLVDILNELDNEDDDWACEELPHVFGKIGEPCIGPLKLVASNDGKPDFIRSIAIVGMRRVADYYPHTRDRVVSALKVLMDSAADDHLSSNSTLLMELVDLHAVEAAESIERAFAANHLDLAMMGDWEEVRKILGVQGMGLKMPDKPHDSRAKLRLRLGMGIFSDQPLFSAGEIDHEAQKAYFKRAYNTFSKSSEAKQVIERFGDIGWFQSLLDFGLNYLGESVDAMTPQSVEEYVTDFVPRKVSTEASSAKAIIGELIQFWKYLDRVYHLPSAKAIIEWLEDDGVVDALESDLSEPANFGMAKSFFMMGKQAGYDMTTQAGLAEFTAHYNRSLSSNRQSASLVQRGEHVGRNETCPCGSGKKFKKCCGGPGQRG